MAAVPTLLLVEDDEEIRDMLRRRLERRGHRIVCASDGETALRMIRERPPDVVLMDGRLPGMSGWDAVRALRADPRTEPLPIIAITAHVLPEERRAALDAGCDAFVPKPVDLSLLLELIERVTGSPAR